MNMNKTFCFSVALAVLTAPGLASGDDGATLRGALVGAAAGLIVAHHGNVPGAVAVPVGALAGGLIANEVGHYSADDYSHDSGRDSWRHHRANRYYSDDFDRDAWRHPPQPRQIIVIKEVPKQKAVEAPKPPDLQPGVDLIKVSITLANGTSVDIPVLRIGERFVGPQGEEYPSLPTAKQLAEKYAK